MPRTQNLSVERNFCDKCCGIGFAGSRDIRKWFTESEPFPFFIIWKRQPAKLILIGRGGIHIEKVNVRCTEREKKMLELMRGIKFGELRIIIQDNEPYRVEEIRNSIKL